MNTRELMDALSARNAVDDTAEDLNMEITCGYTCDLLSWVMAHGQPGMAWITVQTHVNVIAVAVLMEMACVILPEGVALDDASLRKAREERLAVLMSSKTAYELSGIMVKMGILPPAE